MYWAMAGVAWEGLKVWEVLLLCLCDNCLFDAVAVWVMLRGGFLVLWGRKWLL